MITYQLAKAGEVNLSVYDENGVLVDVLVDEYQKPGAHQVTFEAGNRSSGVYIYVLKQDEIELDRKMILIR